MNFLWLKKITRPFPTYHSRKTLTSIANPIFQPPISDVKIHAWIYEIRYRNSPGRIVSIVLITTAIIARRIICCVSSPFRPLSGFHSPSSRFREYPVPVWREGPCLKTNWHGRTSGRVSVRDFTVVLTDTGPVVVVHGSGCFGQIVMVIGWGVIKSPGIWFLE